MTSKDVRGSQPAHLAAAHGNSFTLCTILRAGVVSVIDNKIVKWYIKPKKYLENIHVTEVFSFYDQ